MPETRKRSPCSIVVARVSIYRFALQMSGSKTIAEDVTQEVFLFLMRDGHLFDPAKGSVSAFLLGVARNHVLRRLRVEQHLAPLGDEFDDDVALSPSEH